MALPTPGASKNSWGAQLNEFLRVAHNDDGTLKDAASATDLTALIADVDQIDADVTTLSGKTPWLQITPGMSTATIQGEIDTLEAAGGGQARFANDDSYEADTILLKKNVHIIGAGEGATVINAKAGSTAPGLIGLSTVATAGGEISRSSVRGVSLNGNAANADQWGIYFKGVAGTDSPFDGGLWYADLDFITVRNFRKGGMWLRGGPTSNLIPHQFLGFRRLNLAPGSAASAGWLGLVISGQVGQVQFDVLEVTGDTTDKDATYGIYILRECNDSFVNLSDSHPYSIQFNVPTIQGCDIGMLVDRAQGISLISPWFEDNKRGIHATNNAQVDLIAPQFRDSGADGSGTGYLARTSGSAKMAIDKWTVVGGADSPAFVDATTDGLLALGQPAGGSTLNTYGSNPKSLTAAATIVPGYSRYVIVQGATVVTTITSYLGPDDTITMRMGSDVTFASTGNIRFGAWSGPSAINPAFVATNSSVLVFKIDRVQNLYTLVSYNGRGSQRRRVTTHTASATIPSTDDIILADATAGAINLTLPSVSSHEGKQFTIKKIDASANAVNILRIGSDTFDYGAATSTALTTQNQTVRLVSNGGTVWMIV